MNLLDTTPNASPKLRIRNSVEINYETRGMFAKEMFADEGWRQKVKSPTLLSLTSVKHAMNY